ncbi:MAG: PKD-like domain-containing protein, partial [Saprospiraceae bacterium]
MKTKFMLIFISLLTVVGMTYGQTCLPIIGSYTTPGTTTIPVDGPNDACPGPGTANAYGHIDVTGAPGTAVVTGILAITDAGLIAAADVGAGLALPIITATGGVTGTFATENFPTIASSADLGPMGGTATNLMFSTTYNTNDVTLNITDPCDSDNTGPAMSCNGVISYTLSVAQDGSGTKTLSDTDLRNIAAGTTDNCSSFANIVFTVDIATFDCSHIGTQSITITATDASGNSTTCNTMVGIQDGTDPVAICPALPGAAPAWAAGASAYVVISAGTGTLAQDALGDGSSTDNCVVTETNPMTVFDCSHIGIQPVILTATDGVGLQHTTSCSVAVGPPAPVYTGGAVADACSDNDDTGNVSINLDGFTGSGTAVYTLDGTVPSNPDYNGLSGSASINNNILTDNIVNTTGATVTVTYTIIPTHTTSGCAGNAFAVTIDILPEPVVADYAIVRCSNEEFRFYPDGSGGNSNYLITGTADGFRYDTATVATGLTYIGGWPATFPANPEMATFTTSDTWRIGNDEFENTTSGPLDVVYTITPINRFVTGPYIECEGDPFTITVTIEPKPQLSVNFTSPLTGTVDETNTTATQTVCNMSMFASTSTTSTAASSTGDSLFVHAVLTDANNLLGFGGNGTYNVPISAVASISNTLDNMGTAADMITLVMTPYFESDVAGGGPFSMDSDECRSYTPLTITTTVEPDPEVSIAITAPTAFTLDKDNDYTATVCSGTMFTTGAISVPNTPSAASGSFNWVRIDFDDPGNLLGPGATEWSQHLPSGPITVNQTLTNTAAGPVTLTGTITPYFENQVGTSTAPTQSDFISNTECAGESMTFTVIVNPEPVGVNSTKEICSEAGFTFDPQDNINTNPGGNSVSSSFTWTASVSSGTLDNSITTNGTGNVTETMTNTLNTSGSDAEITYTVFPTSSATPMCPGVPAQSFTIIVTVLSQPVLTDPTPTTCSDVALAVDLAAATTMTGNTYSWYAVDNADVTGETLMASPSTSVTITDVLVNTTGVDQTVVYKVTPTSAAPNACEGEEFDVTVIVQPRPTIQSSVTGPNSYSQAMTSGNTYNIVICSDAMLTAMDVVPGGTTVDPSACGDLYVHLTYKSLGLLAFNGLGDVPVALPTPPTPITPHNGTATDQDIRFVSTPYYDVDGSFDLSAGDVVGDSIIFIVTVQPDPIATPSATTETICSAESPSVTVDVTAEDGNNYLVDDVQVISGTATGYTAADYIRADGDIIDATTAINNTGNNVAVVQYTIVPYTYGADEIDDSGINDDCQGTPFTVDVSVEPVPMIVVESRLSPYGGANPWSNVADGDNIERCSDDSNGPAWSGGTSQPDGSNDDNIRVRVSSPTTPTTPANLKYKREVVFSGGTLTTAAGATNVEELTQDLSLSSTNDMFYNKATWNNISTTDGIVTITLTPYIENGTDDEYTPTEDCLGTAVAFTITVHPEPEPIAGLSEADPILIDVCSGVPFSWDPSTNINNIPTNTEWRTKIDTMPGLVIVLQDLSGFPTTSPSGPGSGSGANTNALAGTIINNSSTIQEIPYRFHNVRSIDNQCEGNDFWVTLRVGAPVMGNISPGGSTTLCEGQMQTAAGTATQGDPVFAYAWTITNNTATGTVLDDATIQSPTITAGVAGAFDLELVITDNQGCVSPTYTESFTVNPAPTATAATLEACEDPSGSAQGDFTLTDADSDVLGSQLPANFTVTYYPTVSDANDGLVIAQLSSPYTSIAGSIWARVEDNASLCFALAEITLDVNILPILTETSMNISCNGLTDGSAGVTVDNSGELNTISYLWDDTAVSTTSSITGLSMGTYIVVVSSTSASGNVCTTSATFTIVEPPVLTAATNQLTYEACTGTAQVHVLPTGGTPPYMYSADGTTYQVPPVLNLMPGTYASITVKDANGCTAVAPQVVVNQDLIPPSIGLCPSDMSHDTDIDECEKEITYNTPSVQDACQMGSWKVSYANGTPVPAQLPADQTLTSALSIPITETYYLGETVVTYTATDAAGNVSLCTFTVAVTEDDVPTFEDPDDVTITTENSSDCPMAATVSINAGDVVASGMAYTVGNVAFTAPALETTYDVAASGYADGGYADKCNVAPVLTLDSKTFDNTDPCSTTWTLVWMVTDSTTAYSDNANDYSNTVFQTQVITIVDDTDPVLANQSPITRNTEDHAIACPHLSTLSLTAGTVVTPGTPSVPGTTYTIGDGTTDMTFDVPALADLSDNCQAVSKWILTASAIDMADITDATSGNTCGRSWTITWELDDGCGNSVTKNQIITFTDTTPAEFGGGDTNEYDISLDSDHGVTCPADAKVMYAGIEAVDGVVIDYTTTDSITVGGYKIDIPSDFSDNCNATPILVLASIDEDDDDTPCTHEWTLTFEITDGCNSVGQAGDFEITVTIDDDEAPEFSAAAGDFDHLTLTSGTCPAAAMVMYNGNALADGDVVALGADIMVGGQPVDVPNAAAVMDTCTVDADLVLSVDNIAIDNSNSCQYEVTIDWIVTDLCDNESDTYEQNILLKDDDGPTASGSSNTYYTMDDGVDCPTADAYTVVDLGAAANTVPLVVSTNYDPNSPITFYVAGQLIGTTADLSIMDNCQNMELTVVSIAKNVLATPCQSASFLINWKIEDQCGNTSVEVAQEFVIVDDTPPTIGTMAADMTVECDGTADPNGAFATWLANYGGANASDNCANVTWSYPSGTALSDDCGATGAASVTFTATDDCGNASTTTATFTIEDTVDPYWLLMPANMTVECGDPQAMSMADWLVSFSGMDNCSGAATVTHNSTGLSDDCGMTGSETVTFTLTDDCGRSITKDATFTIVDTTDPTWVVAPSDMTVECGDPQAMSMADWLVSFSGMDD